MYISEVTIKGFRNFLDCVIPLNNGLTVLIGENNTGKTNFLHAIELVFSPDASERTRRLTKDDFCVDLPQTDEPPEILISCKLSGIEKDEEKSVVATWWNDDGKTASVNYLYKCDPAAVAEYKKGNEIPDKKYHWFLYGGESQTRERFEFDQLRKITIEVLEALRDAERVLRPGYRSGITRLVKHFDSNEIDIEKINRVVKLLNLRLARASQVKSAQKSINSELEKIAGNTYLQTTRLTPVGTEYEDLLRNLMIEAGEREEEFHPLAWNGLGYNNILYISILLAEYSKVKDNFELALPVLAIEEPEAHLHPHLQTVLNRNFAKAQIASQIIATTHSSHVTSSVPLEAVVILHKDKDNLLNAIKISDALIESGNQERYKDDLERYLDATKSTLFYARSVLLVEGMAEALILPKIVQCCTKPKLPLDELGISIIPLHGLMFRPFLSLFSNKGIKRKCVALVDSDSKGNPLKMEDVTLSSMASNLCKDFNTTDNPYTRVVTNLKTLEYDLTIAGYNEKDGTLPNREYIVKALENTDGVSKKGVDELSSVENPLEFANAVLGLVSGQKGRFAQALANEIDGSFIPPDFIENIFSFLV